MLFHRPARLADGLGPESGPGPTDPCAPATPFRRRGVGFPAPRRQPGIRLQQPVHCPRQMASASSRGTPAPRAPARQSRVKKAECPLRQRQSEPRFWCYPPKGAKRVFFRAAHLALFVIGTPKPSAFSRRPSARREATKRRSHAATKRREQGTGNRGATERRSDAGVGRHRLSKSGRECRATLRVCAAGASMGSRTARLSGLGGDWRPVRGIGSRDRSGAATAVHPRTDRGAGGGGEGWGWKRRCMAGWVEICARLVAVEVRNMPNCVRLGCSDFRRLCLGKSRMSRMALI